MPSPSVLQQGSKPAAVEELLDTYVYRRLAAPLVPWFARMGLSPNQVTGLTLLSGLTVSALLVQDHFVAAGLMMGMTVVFDCCDGMLARWLGRSDPLGRILDGLVDTIWIVLSYVAMFNSRHFGTYPTAPLAWLMSLAGASMILHCGIYDGLKTKYLSRCEPGFTEKNLTRQEVADRLQEAFARHRYLLGLLYVLVWMHAGLFARKVEVVCPAPDEGDCKATQSALQRPMRLWSFLGESTHLTVMALAACATPLFPDALLWGFGIILIPFNILWIWAGISWRRAWISVNRQAG